MQKNPHSRNVTGAKNKRWIIPSLVLCLSFFADRLLKYHVTHFVTQPNTPTDNWIQYTNFHNTGIAFSLPLHNTLTVILTLTVLCTLVWYVTRHKNNPQILFGTSSIILGSLSNLFDRLTTNGVIDYLLLFNTSAINLADLLIILGTIILCLKATSPQHRFIIPKTETN